MPSKLRVDESDDGLAFQAGYRDAFHMPCVLVTSNDVIMPGEAVEFDDAEFKTVIPTENGRVMVASPFVSGPIQPGRLFWVFINPDTVQGFSHDFKIPGEESKSSIRQVSVEEQRDEDDRRMCHATC